MENSNPQNLKTIGLIVYSATLILMVLYPPVEQRISGYAGLFQGWYFISELGGVYQIKIAYLLIEIGIATLIYIFFLYSQKK